MSVSASSLLKLIQRHGLRVFTSADIITLTGMSPAAATMALRRLAAQDLVARIKKGVWVNRLAADLNPYEAVPHLRTPWPAYVSLYSALADYGIVEEVPRVVYGISSALPKRYRTPIGEFHIHHLPERLIWGYDIRKTGQCSYPMADAEKAFLDQVYLALIPRSRIGFPHKRGRRWDLDKAKLRRYAARFQFPPLTKWLKKNGL